MEAFEIPEEGDRDEDDETKPLAAWPPKASTSSRAPALMTTLDHEGGAHGEDVEAKSPMVCPLRVSTTSRVSTSAATSELEEDVHDEAVGRRPAGKLRQRRKL